MIERVNFIDQNRQKRHFISVTLLYKTFFFVCLSNNFNMYVKFDDQRRISKIFTAMTLIKNYPVNIINTQVRMFQCMFAAFLYKNY